MAANCHSNGKYTCKSGIRHLVHFCIKFTGADGADPTVYSDVGNVLDKSLAAPVERVSEGLYRLHLAYDCADIYAVANAQSTDVNERAQVSDTDLTQGSNHIDVVCIHDNTGLEVDDLADTVMQVVGCLVPAV